MTTTAVVRIALFSSACAVCRISAISSSGGLEKATALNVTVDDIVKTTVAVAVNPYGSFPILSAQAVPNSTASRRYTRREPLLGVEKGGAASLLRHQSNDSLDKPSAIADIFSTTVGPSNASSDESARKTMRIRLNGEGDTEALVGAFLSVCAMSVPVLLMFMFLRRRFPLLYAYRDLADLALPAAPEAAASSSASLSADAAAGGFTAARRVEHVEPEVHLGTAQEVIQNVGLDPWMHLEFHNVALRIITCLIVVVPTVLCPLHWMSSADSETKDFLSRFSLPTREDRPGLDALWVHALIVWLVVAVTAWNLYSAQSRFLPLRFAWLRQLKYPQSHSILVDYIPEAYRTDEELKKYFVSLFSSDAVKRAYVVRQTRRLTLLVADLENVTGALAGAVAMPVRRLGERVGHLYDADTSSTPTSAAAEAMLPESSAPAQNDGVASEAATREHRPTLIRRQSLLQTQVAQETRRLETAEKLSNSGFVTFSSRRLARQASHEPSISSNGVFLVREAPDPSDVLYTSLEEEPNMLSFLAGWMSVFGFFVAFTPLVVLVTATLNLDSLAVIMPWLAKMESNLPKLHAMLEGVIASSGLSLLMSTMPTIFRLIVNRFFRPIARAGADLSVMRLAFAFQFVFVLLGVALGQGLTTTLSIIADHPVAVLPLLGRTMPLVSHFYLSFMTIGVLSAFIELLRCGPLLRYLTLPSTTDQNEALIACANFTATIGQRTAKSSILLVVPLVFCSLCPLILFVGWIYFSISRVVYGYLYRKAETKRADLGGAFFVHCLHQGFTGLVLYTLLMFSVICVHSGGDVGPPMVVAPAIPVVFFFWYGFRASHQWEVLPLDQAALLDDEVQSSGLQDHEVLEYEQPECRMARMQLANAEADEPK